MKRRWKGISAYFRSHLWFQVSCLFCLAVFSVTVFYHRYLEMEYTDFLMEKSHMMESGVLETMQKNLDHTLQEYIEMGASMSTNEEVYDAVKDMSGDFQSRAGTELDLRTLFAKMASLSPSVLNITLVLEDGSAFQYDRLYQTSDTMWGDADREFFSLMYSQVYKKANKALLPRYLVSSYPRTHPVNGQRVFHIFYPVIGRNYSFEKMNAMISVTFSMNVLHPLFDIFEGDEMAYTTSYVTDAFDVVIMHSQEEYIGKSQSAYLSGKEIIVLDQPLEKLGWNLHVALDQTLLEENIGRSVRNGMITYILLMAGLALIFWLLIKKYTDPINKIQRAMTVTGSGHRREHVEIEGNHEIWRLAQVYNEMIDKLLLQEQETEKHYQLSLVALNRQHQAEMEALESQINTHFLCNTLGTINYEAMEKGDYQVALLIKKLSNILRYTFDRKCQKVYMYQEFAWIEQYLYLQKARLEDVFDYTVEFPEEYGQWPCCKLMLQPFVENAVIHGFEGWESGGRIGILARKKGDFLEIRITDNGCGIEAEKAKRLQEILDGEMEVEQGDIGIGIQNVAMRMRFFYGSEVKLTLISAPEEGTEFVLLLPSSEKKEGENL